MKQDMQKQIVGNIDDKFVTAKKQGAAGCTEEKIADASITDAKELGIPISAAATAVFRKRNIRILNEGKIERRVEIPEYCRKQEEEKKEEKKSSSNIVESAPSLSESNNDKETQGMVSIKTKARRPRRRNRLSYASRIIMGFSLAFLLCTPVLSISLWNSANPGYFIQPKKIFRNGDIITILVQEKTTADHQWKSERDKEWGLEGTADATGAGAGNKNLFGRFFPFMGLDYKSNLKTDNSSDRSTKLAATVAAEIVNIMPNGNLQIIARKVIRVNSEEQLIELTGNVRPDDISENNVVSSNSIADASIKVNGTLRYMNDLNPSPLEKIFSFVSGLFL